MIAIDWGTTHARAFLVGEDARILARKNSGAGISNLGPGDFPAAFEILCASWLAAAPDIPVVMAGMIGSRNGWIEAPYVRAPCGAPEIARAFASIDAGVRKLHVAPGVELSSGDGAYDVMRGEETKCLGAGVTDGYICLPGTHCKWAEIRGGQIIRFATFVTGEIFGAVSNSFVARLAEAPDDFATAARGLAAAGMPGGPLRAMFQARTQVLAGAMQGNAVRPFLSGLLIGTEIAGASDLFGALKHVHLIAGPPQLDLYKAALAARKISVTVIDPEAAFVTGLLLLAKAANLTGS